MPSTPGTLAYKVREKYPGAYDDLDDAALESAITAKHPGAYDDIPRSTLPTRPVSSEDFAPASRPISIGNILSRVAHAPIDLVKSLVETGAQTQPEDAALGPAAVLAPFLRSAASGAGTQLQKSAADLGRGRVSEGVGHLGAAALPLVGPAAADAGEDIGSGDPERMERGIASGITQVGSVLAPAAARVAPRVAPGLASIGEQIVAKGKAIPPGALELASHLPVIGGPLRLATTGRKILGRLLDLANPETPNAGGRLVKGVGPNIDHALADALEELRKPETPDSVELPPPADLPPGYEPRTSAPALATPNVGGRLVPQKAPTATQALADVLAELQRPPPPARVTTAPPASLPPGYTPRASGPRLVAKSAPVNIDQAIADARAADAPAAAPKRAYFLKPESEMTAPLPTTAPVARAPAAIDVSDLPTSWRGRTGPEPIPPQGQAGNHLADAFADELRARGLSAKDAIAMVTKNPSLPPPIRLQIIAALKQAGRSQ